MKKILIYLILFILVFFILPAILTTRTKSVLNQDIKLEENATKDGEYKKIKLLHSDTDEVEEIDLKHF